MSLSSDSRNPDLPVSGTVSGYEIKRVAEIREMEAFFYELEHLRTGARHIHLSTPDRNNTFSVAFKTVPRDSTGVAHILEHIVLCGSRNYPVRDPFFSMIKRSLNSFMNAFTASDWTMYPFSTQNTRDYYNLAAVYLDAAFFPLLDRLSFKQEGHRLEIAPDTRDNAGGNWHLSYQGVVYNEMKGAMSSPAQVMVRALLNALYPDTTYSFNSGGDPAEIPRLTHEQLKAFHQRHYHPSNAFFYTCGDLPLKTHLEFIEQTVLAHFERIDPQTDVTSQPRWTQPCERMYAYPLDAGVSSEDNSRKSQACVAWLLADITDSFEVLTLVLLEQVLLGNAAAPLRKALLDSQLGSALCDGTGYDTDNRDTMFVCGLKDVAVTDAAAVEKIVLGVMEDLCRNGIPADLVASALHQIEFARKEVTHSPYPYGIKLLITFAGSWFHGADVLRILEFEPMIRRLREQADQPGFLEGRLRRFFLENPHRARVTLAPDAQLAQVREQRVMQELATLQAGLTAAEVDALKQDAAALQALQKTSEDNSCLPTLHRSDVPPQVERTHATREAAWPGVAIYDQPTAGIFYCSSVAGINGIADDLAPMLPFYSYAFTRMGTRYHDYASMSQRMAACTGGIGLGIHARRDFGGVGACLPLVSFSGKCLTRNLEPMFDIMAELLSAVDFSDHVRLKNLLLEYRAGLEAAVVQNGHRLAMLQAARRFSPVAALKARWQGVYQLKMLKELTRDLSAAALQRIADRLLAINAQLFKTGALQTAVIGETAALQQVWNFLPVLPSPQSDSGSPEPAAFSTPPATGLPCEGWATTSAVSFVAACFQTVRLEHPDAPALAVISKMLQSLYLHREIREKGGAYGGYALYDSEDGLFGFCSYRDPHIVRTLNVYNDAFNFIRDGNWKEDDVEEAVLQICAAIDKPHTPAEAARKAFFRSLLSLSDTTRQRHKTALLALNASDVRDVAHRCFNPETVQQGIAVISDAARLAEANTQLADRPMQIVTI